MRLKNGKYYKLVYKQYTLYAFFDNDDKLHILKDTDTRAGMNIKGQKLHMPGKYATENWQEIDKSEVILEVI